MRCCLLSLDDAMVAATEPPKEGDIVKCKFHEDPEGMVFKNGAWEWNHTSAFFKPRS